MFHGVVRLCCRIEYNRSVAKFKRWGRTTEGRDEHMISGCLEHTAYMRFRGEGKLRRFSPWRVSVAHDYEIHLFCSLHGQCGCFLLQQGATTLTM